jgi:hypothetical protein
MNQVDYERELHSFDEKIALAELEESKAAQRVKEIKYQKARFSLEIYIAMAREKEVLKNKG